jgi:hypothetical protein
MNEKLISELALKSYIVVGDYSYCESVIDPKKFAELIIKECASICEHRYTYMNKDMSEGAFEAMACHDSILEHFGIE